MIKKIISKTLAAGFLFAAAVMLTNATPAFAADSAADNYSIYCVQCHGTAGTGKGINAPVLAVAPRNHTSAKDMAALSDDGVALAIKSGGIAVGKSSQMPPFGALMSDAEINDLVKHLRKMCKCEGKK